MKQIIVWGVSDEIHKTFKIHCANKETTINSEIIWMMTKELEGQGKLKRERS